jgi:hypothetical protein
MPIARPSSPWATVWAIATACAALLLGGCGDDAEPAVDTGLMLRLVIPDANIREPDVPCSGARAFRFAHPEAAYAIEDPSGQQVAAGTLPDGRAEKAFNIDLGEDRQPTVCVMMVDVQGVESLDGHALAIGDRTPVPIEPNRNLDDIPEVVLR